MMNRPPKQPKISDFVDPKDVDAYRHSIRRYTGDPVPDDYQMGQNFKLLEMSQFFGALMTSPLLCAAAGDFGTFLRTAGDRPNTYSHAQRELADQVLSVDNNTNVVQRLHIAEALATGVRIEAIKALRYGHEADLNDDERLIVKFVRQTVNGTVDNETYAAIEELMGIRGLVEYAGLILFLQWSIRLMQVLGVYNPPDAEIDKIVSDLESGRQPIPDYRASIR